MLKLLLFSIGVSFAAAGCLPGDTRPAPGSVLTTVSGSEATRGGFTSADGWQVRFERVLLGAGPVQLGDDCRKYAEYSEPGYERLLDLTGPPAQKLGVMFGLGKCDIDFQLSPPGEDVVLGQGVSGDDKAYMRSRGGDAFVSDEGVVLHVQGSATKAGRTLRFAWDLRQSLFFVECSVTSDGQVQAGLSLVGGVDETYDLLLETEGLFRDNVATGGVEGGSNAGLRFAPFADADAGGDADGWVTLSELAHVPLADLSSLGPYVGSGGDATLADYLYRTEWPALVRYRGTGACKVSLYED